MAYDSSNPFVVADAAPADRAQFYRRTYAHVAGAFALWAVLLGALFVSGAARPIMKGMFAFQYSWLLVMGLFWIATTVGKSMAFNTASKAVQYAGLGLYTLAEAVIFVPLITLVAYKTEGHVMDILAPAGLTTALLIGGLTATVFLTNKDFSFLRTAVIIGSLVALGVIVGAVLFGICLGFWFAAAMVLLMAVAILYQTHQIKTQLSTEHYVGAALILFGSFMTMLWYVIQLFSSRSRD